MKHECKSERHNSLTVQLFPYFVHSFLSHILRAKAAHWEREFQFHTPTAEQLRQRSIVRAGRDEQRATQPVNAEVQELLQARTALLGGTFDPSTRNSLRVASRHGEDHEGKLKIEPYASQPPYPVPVAATRPQSAMDNWASRTLPGERIANFSQTPQGTFSSSQKLARSSFGSSLQNRSQRLATAPPSSPLPLSSFEESTYSSSFCSPTNRWTTRSQNFFSDSLQSFEESPVSRASYHPPRPLSPTLSLPERIANERVSSVSLESMQRPLARKVYPDLRENSANTRPDGRAYNFDMMYHIERMRPAPLKK